MVLWSALVYLLTVFWFIHWIQALVCISVFIKNIQIALLQFYNCSLPLCICHINTLARWINSLFYLKLFINMQGFNTYQQLLTTPQNFWMAINIPQNWLKYLLVLPGKLCKSPEAVLTSALHHLVEFALDVELWVFGLHTFQFDGYLLSRSNVRTWLEKHHRYISQQVKGLLDLQSLGVCMFLWNPKQSRFSPRYISPNDPLPIFLPRRYLFPTLNSMAPEFFNSLQRG